MTIGERTYRSGELARAAGVSVDTLRHYERRGLLPKAPRQSNGYRVFGPEALERVLLVQRALSVGFTLAELARFLRARARGAPPCREVRALAAARLAEIEARLDELVLFRETLRKTIADWDRRLASSLEGEPARLLESLSALPGRRAGSPVAALRFQHLRQKRKDPP